MKRKSRAHHDHSVPSEAEQHGLGQLPSNSIFQPTGLSWWQQHWLTTCTLLKQVMECWTVRKKKKILLWLWWDDQRNEGRKGKESAITNCLTNYSTFCLFQTCPKLEGNNLSRWNGTQIGVPDSHGRTLQSFSGFKLNASRLKHLNTSIIVTKDRI